MMTKKAIIIAVLSVFLSSFSYGADNENIYTWKDKNGVINITDTPPPSSAELIATSPSYRKKAERIEEQYQLNKEKRLQYQKKTILKEKAAQARAREKKLRRDGDNFLKQAVELNDKWKFRRNAYGRINQNRVKMYKQKADDAYNQAEKEKKLVEMYERELER